MVQPGERVSAGQPLASVVNGGALDLVASASPDQLDRLGVGQPATVTGEGATAARSGRVHAIAPGVDSLTGSGSVVIRIAEAGRGLRPGAAATARVTLPPLRDLLIVPDSAVVLVGGTTTVFVVGQDSVARAHPVVVKGEGGGRSAIGGDVPAGASVATSGAYGLADGMHVVPTVPHRE
jgi:RND family efflux transporter MFP subunit